MKILIIGGTKFIGRHLSEILLHQGHDLYLLNRGQSDPTAFSGVPKLIGDRNDAKVLEQINGRGFDVIVDMCAYFPAEVELLLDTLKDFQGHYVFASTVSVYKNVFRESVAETSDLLECSVAQKTDSGKESYGARKAECERVIVQKLAKTNWTIIRPTVVFGPHDPTYRVNWWIDRVKAGTLILPDDPQYQLNLGYVEDLANAFATVAANPACFGEIYNFAHPQPEGLEHLVCLIRDILKVDCHIEKLSANVMKEKDILPWRDIPLYLSDQSLLFDVKKIAALKGIEFTDTKAALVKTCAFHLKKVPI